MSEYEDTVRLANLGRKHATEAFERYREELERALAMLPNNQPKKPQPTDEQKCLSCRFMEHERCYRYPPLNERPGLMPYFPKVYPEMWCGEYHPRDPA